MATFVYDVSGGLSHIADDEPIALRCDANDLVGYGKSPCLTQQRLYPYVVDEELSSHTNSDPALEGLNSVDRDRELGL